MVVADGKVIFSTLGPPTGSDSAKTVREVSVEGTGERTLISSVPGVTDIALTPNLVLFRTWDDFLGGTVRACNRTGACNQALLVDIIGAGRGLVPTSSFFYWGGTYALRRCTVLGCSPPEGLLMQANVSIEGMVTDGTSLYWTNGRSDYGGFAVYGCTAPACLNGAPIHARTKKPTALAIAGPTLCWAENASVVCAPKSGGTPVVVASGDDALERVTSVAADDNHVYFTLEHDIKDRGRVMRAALTNKTPSAVELAKGQHRPRGVALDATHVYWANAPGDATGSLRRIAK